VLCSYDEFMRKTDEMVRGLKAQGLATKKFAVDVDHMAAWCERHGYPIGTSASRSAYGAILAMHGGELFDLDTPFDDGGQLRRRQ
jgi:hypothetical protein